MNASASGVPGRVCVVTGGARGLGRAIAAALAAGGARLALCDVLGEALAETAADFAIQTLVPGGAFIAKVFAGGADRQLLTMLKHNFTTVKHAKPPASRKGSPELYVIAQGFKGRRGAEAVEKE